MLYNLLTPYAAESHIANLFRYITFRSGLAIVISLSFCFIFGPCIIKYLRKWQKLGQPIRDDGPETHKSKAGTPTMGGVMMIGGIVLATLLVADLTNPFIWITLFVFISFAILGFMDDYLKVSKRNTKGVSGKAKMAVQLLVSVIACFLIQTYSANDHINQLAFPFFKSFLLDLGIFYIPFVAIVIIGSSNAVNLTDGLDGLASVPIAITALCFGIFSYVVGNIIFANYLQLIYVPHVGELAIICAAIVGSSLGFLWFNAQPAEVFMGDTGSLSLGGALGVISVIIKHEIVLAIVGGLFVIEALSVIIQVYYFKFTKGKRIFLMAPLHHHFEKAGWPESKVVVRFWILGVIFGLIGLATLKLR
jgi:phospho-N-acetylmuramoyl-pentapeptide-transferase